LPAVRQAGNGTLRRDASFESNLLRTVTRPESRPALQRPHVVDYLPFQRPAGRAACSVGVDASWRRVPCRALNNRGPIKLKSLRIHGGWAMAISFQIAHPDFCRKSRTPPFPQTDGPEQILKPNTTTNTPFRGCPGMHFQASLTIHNRSSNAAFENRPPCPYFTA